MKQLPKLSELGATEFIVPPMDELRSISYSLVSQIVQQVFEVPLSQLEDYYSLARQEYNEIIEAMSLKWVVNKLEAQRLEQSDISGKWPLRFVKRLVRCESWKPYYTSERMTAAITKLGELLGPEVVSTTWKVCIDRTFSWKKGEFNDRNSCYWEGRAIVRRVVFPREADAWSVRIWRKVGNSDDDFVAHARCWLAVCYEDGIIGGEDSQNWLLWNAYGESSVRIARVLAKHYDVVVKSIAHLYNDATREGVVYINNDEVYYFVGNGPYPDEMDNRLDLQYNVDDIRECDSCSKFFLEDDLDESGKCDDCSQEVCSACGNDTQEEGRVVGNSLYCMNCYEQLFYRCGRCGTDYSSNSDDSDYCPSCCTDRSVCKSCGDTDWTEGMTRVPLRNRFSDDEFLCENCQTHFAECPDCGKMWDDREEAGNDDTQQCEACFSEAEERVAPYRDEISPDQLQLEGFSDGEVTDSP